MTFPLRRRSAVPITSLNPIALAAVLALSAAPRVADAVTFVWTGAAGNSWSDSGNWGTARAPLLSGLTTSDLIFGGSSAVYPSIDGAYDIRSLTFAAGASGYAFDSGPLTLGAGGLTQNAANAQRFSTAQVVLGADQTWTLADGTGALTFGAGLHTSGGPGNAGRALTLYAATTTGSGNVVNGVISGAGSLTKTGAGMLTLTGASTYTGGTVVNAGVLAFRNASALGTGGITLNSGELRATASAAIAPYVFVNEGASATISAAAGSNLALRALNLYGNASFGAAGQTGTVVLNLTEDSAALTTATITVNAGTLRGGNAGGLSYYTGGAASTTVNAGATLDLNGDATTIRNLQGTGSVIPGAPLATRLTVNAGSFAGAISGPVALTKTTAGTLTLTGASTYIGATTVNGGTLAVASGGSLTGGDLGVNAGGTLAISGTGSVSASSGKTLTVDGTRASPATVTLAGSARLSTDIAYVGNDGVGRMTQSGGQFSTGVLVLGFNPGSSGAYTLTAGSISTSYAYVGFYGAGTFTQTGGTFTTNGNALLLGLAGGAAYTLSGNGSLTTGSTYVGAGTTIIGAGPNSSVFTQSGGTHTTGTLLVGGSTSSTYHLDGGTLAAGSVTNGPGSTVFNFNGGTLQATGDNATFFQGLTTANVRGGGAVFDTNGFDVTVAQELTHSNISGDSATDGGLTKNGAGTLTLTGANTYTGALSINAGTVAVGNENALGAPGTKAVTVGGSGTLLFTGSTTLARTYNLGIATLAVGSGSTLTFASGAGINGGYLNGPGTAVLANGATLSAVTSLVNSTLSQGSATATFNNSTLRGTLAQTGGTLALNNGYVTGSGRLGIGGTVNTTGTEIQGVTTIASGGTLANSGSSLYLSAGSRTTVASGGTLSTAAGTSIELNGSQLVNNGRQTGVLDINYGSLAKGSGSFGTVNVADGGRFSPGNSPGTATAGSFSFGAGGRYDFELNTASPSFGVDSDLLKVTDTLSITAGTTAGSVFTIGVDSLDLGNHAAALTDFDGHLAYHWLLVDAGTVSGFDSSEFQVDTSGFSNNLEGGSFSVSLNGRDLYLNFNPLSAVPEPSSWAMCGVGMVLVAGIQARRRRLSQA